jgi:hypothetical protein
MSRPHDWGSTEHRTRGNGSSRRCKEHQGCAGRPRRTRRTDQRRRPLDDGSWRTGRRRQALGRSHPPAAATRASLSKSQALLATCSGVTNVAASTGAVFHQARADGQNLRGPPMGISIPGPDIGISAQTGRSLQGCQPRIVVGRPLLDSQTGRANGAPDGRAAAARGASRRGSPDGQDKDGSGRGDGRYRPNGLNRHDVFVPSVMRSGNSLDMVGLRQSRAVNAGGKRLLGLTAD